MTLAWRVRVGSLVLMALSLGATPAAAAATPRLDGRFGEGGIARMRFRIPLDQADTLPLRPVRQPDGKLLLAAARGEFHGNSQIVLARFTRRGRRDPTFGHGGRERLGMRWNFQPHAVHVLPDGRILVLGAAGFAASLYPFPHQFALIRLLPDGSRDRTFGTNGFVTWNPPWRPETTYMNTRPGLFVRQSDGRLLAAGEVEEQRADQPGTSARRTVFVRFNPDGSVDTSFGRAGVVEGP